MHLERGQRPLRALTIQVLGALALSLAGLSVARYALPKDVLQRNSDSVGDYLQVLGTIYSVLQAFVVFVVWTQFNDCRALVEREASEVADLFRTTQGLPEPLRSVFRKHLAGYVTTVLDVEWSAMERRDWGALERGSEQLEEAFADLRRFEPKSEHDTVLFSETLVRFNDLSDVRTARLTSSCSRVPMPLRLLLHAGAVLIVASTFLLWVESTFIHMIITGAIAGAIVHIHYIVDDLDDPFGGSWTVPRVHFERVRRLLDKDDPTSVRATAA